MTPGVIPARWPRRCLSHYHDDVPADALTAFSDLVVVSLLMHDDEGYHHLPAIVVDIGSDQIETLPVPGVATIVP